MSKPSCIGFPAVAFILVCCTVAAASVAMVIARQSGAPAHLVQTTHGLSDLLTAARLKNDSDKAIASYRIGWAYVRPNEIEFHIGVEMNVPPSIKPGTVHHVSDQNIAFDTRAEEVIFFVAELTFADGTGWKANNEDIKHEFYKALDEGRR